MVKYAGPLNTGLTLALAGLFVWWLKVAHPTGALPQFGIDLAVVLVAITAAGPPWRWLAAKRGLNPVNCERTHEQGWQLLVHVIMTYYNLEAWGYLADTNAMWTEPVNKSDDAVTRVYILQTAVWFGTAFRHRFASHRAKDYILMYVHHVITLFLIVGSWHLGIDGVWHIGARRIGAIVLFLHDSSDIVIDILRLSHSLGLDDKSGTFIAEGSFVTNLFTWAYLRLYIYPTKVLNSAWFESPASNLRNIINVGLTALFCMHIYWYYLFGRILKKLLSKDSSKDAGRDYEGDSEEEGDDDDDAPAKKGK